MNQMREAFEKWYLMQPIAHKSHIVRISNGHYFGAHTETAWQAWQAAQSAAVPVVGEPVAWVRRHPDGALTAEFLEDAVIEPVRRNSGGWLPLFVQPTKSISAAELASLREKAAMVDELRKDAERYRWIRDKSHSLETRQYDKGIVNGPSCYHEVGGIRELKYEGALDAAIDAALAQCKGE